MLLMLLLLFDWEGIVLVLIGYDVGYYEVHVLELFGLQLACLFRFVCIFEVRVEYT